MLWDLPAITKNLFYCKSVLRLVLHPKPSTTYFTAYSYDLHLSRSHTFWNRWSMWEIKILERTITAFFTPECWYPTADFIPKVTGEEAQRKHLADEFSALYSCLPSSTHIYLMASMPTHLSFQTFANSCPSSKKIPLPLPCTRIASVLTAVFRNNLFQRTWINMCCSFLH